MKRRALATSLLILAVAAPIAHGEVTQGTNARVTFLGKLTPYALPRSGEAAVRVAVGAQIAAIDPANPPQLRRIEIEINRHGHFNPDGLPICRYAQVQPATTADALAACRHSLVGKGSFSSSVVVSSEAPFPSRGELYAYNGTFKGKPAILAHIYGTTPIPVSYTIPFTISKGKGAYGTVLSAKMPAFGSEWGYITGLSLNLGRNFTYQGERHSYLSAGCPAPKGFSKAVFSFARASFSFGQQTLSSALTRSCKAQG
jgi:hypothetical protein